MHPAVAKHWQWNLAQTHASPASIESLAARSTEDTLRNLDSLLGISDTQEQQEEAQPPAAASLPLPAAAGHQAGTARPAQPPATLLDNLARQALQGAAAVAAASLVVAAVWETGWWQQAERPAGLIDSTCMEARGRVAGDCPAAYVNAAAVDADGSVQPPATGVP
ncbi:hypothetical protein CHLNCDRAFT_141618 [Chlorella variabilis]|uniref:Uncharacterized protein n=1 Tax=Chlorella variabilis TaxID=554065 RepID=E1ZT64_CHLVA|nr:hypothetical protein CHLNCDRAFT_141618 [Chlorella variabilis]EFN50975.1 hypothetical protein CHLNCDRAFT_141618 [Chlorella variabilis]|eukprot:XP_005843077.1 hypothetical protein CHLNCDRAFT_141618 [Chlorella variabilis]